MFKVIRPVGKSRNVICAIATNSYYDKWKKYASKSWHQYAKKNDLGIIIFYKDLDSSKNAKNIHWQKFLIGKTLSNKFNVKINNICYLDTDVIINPESPNIFDFHKKDKISVISLHNNLPFPLSNVLKRVSFYRNKYYSKLYPLNSALFMTAEQKYKFHKFEIFHDYYCAGIYVYNLNKFKKFFEKVYIKYSSMTKTLTGGDQPYFNYEVNKLGKVNVIDYKFQAIWLYEMAWKYPFLYSHGRKNKKLIRECVSACVMNNYFLHFAGSWHEKDCFKIKNLPTINNSRGELKNFFKYLRQPINAAPKGPIRPKVYGKGLIRKID